MTYHFLKQFPVIPPDQFTAAIHKFIRSCVLELVYTAYDLKPFAEDLDYHGPPFRWDPDRRAILKAELDALYAHLFRINKSDLEYILGTFPIVKRKDEEQFGEYRTKRLIMEKYEELKDKFNFQ